MAILTRINDILRSPLARELKPTPESDQETKRRQHFERLYNYLVNDEAALKRYMTYAMQGLFDPKTIARMPLPYLNIFKRIIKRLSVAYQAPAERYLLVDVEGNKSTENPHNDRYQELLTGSNINFASKTWNEYAKAFDTCYVETLWRKDHVEYELYAPHMLSVVPREDDYLQPARIEYTVTNDDASEETVIWTDTEHKILDDRGRMIEGRNPWNGVNRYGVIPFTPVRLRKTENHWGEGDTQLADINEKINVLLASTNYNAIFQTHGQLYAINFDLPANFRIGPDSVIAVDKVQVGDVMPSVGYIHPDPSIEATLKQIDWMTKTAAMMRGLPASSVSIDETAQSGAAKAIDNQELQELRADDVEMLRPAEKAIYQVSKVVWNLNNPSQKIGDEAVFGIDFELPEIGLDPKTEMEVRDWEFKVGLWTPLDELTDEDEGISREQAHKMWAENLIVRKEYDRMLAPASKKVTISKNADGSFAGSVEAEE